MRAGQRTCPSNVQCPFVPSSLLSKSTLSWLMQLLVIPCTNKTQPVEKLYLERYKGMYNPRK